jgi:hypothetical protein
MIDLLEQYESMHDNNIMLSFKGEVTFDLVNSILKILEERLNRTEEDLKTKKKVYNVLVECLQNLCHHIEEASSEDIFDKKTAILMVYMNDSTYHVLTGNYINNKNIDHLRNWLDQINAVSKDELRELYKKILNNEQFSEKGGGGLGFIDIARKSGQKLNYSFKAVNDNVSFFSFQINIPKQEV